MSNRRGKPGGEEVRRMEEGEEGEQENAEAAIFTRADVGCVCVCVFNETLASIRLLLVPSHPTTATSTTPHHPHQAD